MEKSFSPAAVPAASVWKLPLICLLCEGFWMASAPLRPWSSFSPSLLPDGWLSQSAVLLPPGSVPFSQHLVLPPHNSSGAKKYGYKIKFLLHPILSSQKDDFTPNSELEVIPSVGDLSYEKILTESSLMVTDYSGVQFDFAYMRKPIVYFHPEVLPPHYDDGIFFYDSMGFGEICTKSDQLVDVLCDYMRKGCNMKDMYRERADNFYVYNDHNNCERIYKEIMKYQKQVDIDKSRKK